MQELAYPSQVRKPQTHLGTLQLSPHIGAITARIKKGSQQAVNKPIIAPRVRTACVLRLCVECLCSTFLKEAIVAIENRFNGPELRRCSPVPWSGCK